MFENPKFKYGFSRLLEKSMKSIPSERNDSQFALESAKTCKQVDYDLNQVKKLLNLKSPFIYLTAQEKELLLEKSTFVQYDGMKQEVFKRDPDGTYPCIFLLDGQLIVIDIKKHDSEILSIGDSFGFDACIFNEASYGVVTGSKICTVMKIGMTVLKELLSPDKQFTVMVGSNLLNKQRIFSPIETFRNYVADCVESGEINLKKLLKVYKAIESSLHPGRKSDDLDISAWRYAVMRLPANLCSTFVYFISTSLPDMYSGEKIIQEVKTISRERVIYSLTQGKNYIIVRELVSDINDMLANLCIHVLESKKLRQKLTGPKVLAKMLEKGTIDDLPLTAEEKSGLVKIWGNNVVQQIKNIMVHHEDYRLNIFIPSCHLKMSPIEMWTEQLWEECLKIMGLEISVVEAIDKGLIVDFMQGSTRTILNAVSPYITRNAKTITDWFESTGKVLLSTDLTDPRDRLIAMSYYYFEAFPEEKKKRVALEREAGIVLIDKTHNTGVRVVIINISKLSKYNKAFNPKSNYHLLLYIGFTFGKQSYDLIKNINLLLGKSLVSYTVIGKAGGLKGSRNDTLVATRFFDEVSKNVIRANPAGVSQSLLQSQTGSRVWIGPMLTVSGTVLQNKKMLLYYHYIEGCIGLEMEGAYIALCIKHSIEAGIIKEDVSTRFIYYVSDLPLKADTTLAAEDDNVNWNEGVKSVNGITRYVLGLINRKMVEDISEEIQLKLKDLCKTQEKIIVIGTTADNMNVLNHHTASKLAEDLLEQDFTIIYLTQKQGIKPFMRRISQAYIQSSGFFPEAVAMDLRKQKDYIENDKLMIIDYTSYTDYINKLHCVAESAKEKDRIPFLFTDIPCKSEVLTNLNGSEIMKLKFNYELLKTECPHSTLIFFRTDMDNGLIDQRKLLMSYGFDYIFTRYKESTVVDVVDAFSSGKKQSITAHPSSEVIKKILEILENS